MAFYRLSELARYVFACHGNEILKAKDIYMLVTNFKNRYRRKIISNRFAFICQNSGMHNAYENHMLENYESISMKIVELN